ncbi:hypothetical protein BGX28_001060, partial [Mortierella sp. GBA30]
GYQHVDTNNLVESWHKTLKKVHLGNKRNVRTDYLIYLLFRITNTDFRLTHFKIKSGLQPAPLSAYDKARKAKAMCLNDTIAKDMVIDNMDDALFMVKSFTTPGAQVYTILEINYDHTTPLPQPARNDVNDPDNSDDNNERLHDFGPPLQEMISPALLVQLQASRAREQAARTEMETRRKRARETEMAEEFEQCEVELTDLLFGLTK